ncbi:hypothetical protein HOY34_16565 [Xinfangfangia sp. D13-10-4-6]|uniref:hypothetical protein n=1 Tax=Pseudogemmobacter hezensis TaxID=2737662 RepID=UPI0015524C20|nr:hypothetical protein [Pseudogemmobacter hezensis]NPD16807.1 hypothetical protein [Pseudogemmobacter hezensis]
MQTPVIDFVLNQAISRHLVDLWPVQAAAGIWQGRRLPLQVALRWHLAWISAGVSLPHNGII